MVLTFQFSVILKVGSAVAWRENIWAPSTRKGSQKNYFIRDAKNIFLRQLELVHKNVTCSIL